MEQEKFRTCWVCGEGIKSGFLCAKHRKKYIYYKKYNMVTLRPRRKISKGQNKLFKIVRDVFKEPVLQECVFSWLKYRRYDILVVGKKKIFEADGRQHLEYIPHFHKTKQKFEEAKRVDKMKETIAKENGYLVYRFDYKQLEDDNYVRQEVERIAND